MIQSLGNKYQSRSSGKYSNTRGELLTKSKRFSTLNPSYYGSMLGYTLAPVRNYIIIQGMVGYFSLST